MMVNILSFYTCHQSFISIDIIELFHSNIINSISKEDDEYSEEEREVEVAHNQRMTQHIQMAILQDLHQSLGTNATLPEGAAKELVLQVS